MDIRDCKGINNCNKKECIEQEKCIISAYWVDYWKNKSKKIFPPPTVVGMVKKKKKLVLFPDCDQNLHNCNKPEVCEILGQCLLLHPKIYRDKRHVNYLRQKLGIKEVVKYLSKTMTSLRRIGVRRFYKPDREIDSI